MLRMINATRAKNNFGEMLRQVYINGDHLMIKKGDLPVAAVMPIIDYQKDNRARLAFMQFLETVHQKMPAVSESKANREIASAITIVRKNKKNKKKQHKTNS